MKKNNSGTLVNLFWKFSERISAQLVTLIVSIVLARILEPSHYGTIAIVNIFITLANVFVADGFGSALIQKKDADALDFSSVLYFNVAFSVVLYLILFFAAPFIAAFYGEGYEVLTPVLRVLGIRLIVTGANSIQHAYVSKKMIFKKFFYATLTGTVISGVVGIGMAYAGYGVWALVGQYLTGTIVNTAVLALSLKKVPILAFSLKRVLGLLKFGSRILGSGLLIMGYQELRALIIGKVYSSSDLAFFDKGKQFPSLIVTNINTSIGAVLFPKMAKEQDNIDKIKNTARTSIRFSSFLMCPIMLGFFAVSKPFVSIVLTDKWLPCVPLLQWFCIVYLFQPIHTANMQAIKALGRSDIYLRLEIIKKTIELVVLVLVMNISVNMIVISTALLTVLFTFINAFPNKTLIRYTYKEQLSDILPNVLRAGIMAAVVMAMQVLPVAKLPLMIIQIITGGLLYLVLCKVTKCKELELVFNMLKKKFVK